jgi:aerobic carbon-monoxide dehydrogenase medium subunit
VLPAPLDYLAPTTVDAAVTALAARPDAVWTAGSYRLVIDLKMRRLEVGALVDLRRIAELRAISERSASLSIGAMVSLDALATDPRVVAVAPALAQAAAATGDPQIRHMAALGGTLAYDASTSDVAAALLAYDAVVHTRHVDGARTLRVAEVLAAGGGTTLRRDEVIESVALPIRAGRGGSDRYAHPASLAAIIAVAAALDLDDDGRVRSCAFAVSGALACARRLPSAEVALTGAHLDRAAIQRIRAAVAADAFTWSDEAVPLASPAYRDHRLGVMLGRLLQRLA